MTRLELMNAIMDMGERGADTPAELMSSCMTVAAAICVSAGVTHAEFVGFAGEEYELLAGTNSIAARFKKVTVAEIH